MKVGWGVEHRVAAHEAATVLFDIYIVACVHHVLF